jgi:hypothetical protein
VDVRCMFMGTPSLRMVAESLSYLARRTART